MGRSQDSSREGHKMDKLVFKFQQRRNYIAISEDKCKKEIYQITCSQSQYSDYQPQFRCGNRFVHIVNFEVVNYMSGFQEVETQCAIIRISNEKGWSEDLKVLAFPVDMPSFEYENK